MRCATPLLIAGLVALAYLDPAATVAGAAGFAAATSYMRLCDWVHATRHQSRWHWRAERVRCSLADRDGPGGWA